MRALSLWQPWATLIAMGVKTIETRPWGTGYRGPLAIAATLGKQGFEAIHAEAKATGEAGVEGWLLGYIGDYQVGYCLKADGGWARKDAYIMGPHGPGPTERLPRGAVVAVCNLVDVVPMVELCPGGGVHLVVGPELELHAGFVQQPVEQQRPYGNFAPGRYAWVLEDIQRIDPVPATGKQGLWEWTAGGGLR